MHRLGLRIWPSAKEWERNLISNNNNNNNLELNEGCQERNIPDPEMPGPKHITEGEPLVI